MEQKNIVSILLHDGYIFGNITLYAIAIAVLAVILRLCIQLGHAIYRRWRDISIYKDFDGPKPHWLHGNMHQIPLGKAMYMRVELMKKFGPVYLFHFGFLYRQLVLTYPEYIKTIMNTSEPKDPVGYRFIKPWIGDGLLISEGKKWTRNRRLLTPAFHFDILKPYQTLFSDCANTLTEKWKKILKSDPDKSLEMFNHISLLTLDSLMKCIFGVSDNIQTKGEQNPYIKSVYDMSYLISQRFRTTLHHNDLLYYFSLNGYRFRKVFNFAKTFSQKIIDQKREEMATNGNTVAENDASLQQKKKYLDFIDMLLLCRDTDGNGLSNDDIQAEVDTFMFEGHDTTASGISWCLYNLANNKEYQDRCREEVENVLGNRTKVEWEDLPKLNYLTMCIKESLRTHPPVAGTGRITTKDHKLPDGRMIPKGTWISLSIYACHHNPEHWPNPDEYNPERFAPDAMKNRHSHAFVPFSTGPRNCIGQTFAMNELKTIIALLVKNFSFDVDHLKPADPQVTLILRSKGGLWLNVTPR